MTRQKCKKKHTSFEYRWIVGAGVIATRLFTVSSIAHIASAQSSRIETYIEALWTKFLVVVPGVILLAIVSAVMQPVHAQSGPCRPVMDEMLAEGGLRPGDARSVEYDVSTGANGTGPIHMGWVRLNSCRGYLVNQTTENCLALKRFTLGACAEGATLQSRVPNGGS